MCPFGSAVALKELDLALGSSFSPLEGAGQAFFFLSVLRSPVHFVHPLPLSAWRSTANVSTSLDA